MAPQSQAISNTAASTDDMPRPIAPSQSSKVIGRSEKSKHAIKHVAQPAPEFPCALAYGAGPPLVRDFRATKPQPEQLADKEAVALLQGQECIAEHAIAGKHVDAAGGDVAHDQCR
jgi:hypothetical protein